MSGWYTIQRGTWDDEMFKDEPFTEREAWIWLNERAYYKQNILRHKSKIIEIQKGQIPTSYRKLKKIWKWGNQRIAKYIKLLEMCGKITTSSGTGFLIITLCNHTVYEDSQSHPDTPTTTPPETHSHTHPETYPETPAETQPGTKLNKGNKENKENKYISLENRNGTEEKLKPQTSSPKAHSGKKQRTALTALELPDKWLRWTQREIGWSTIQCYQCWEQFRDYWTSENATTTLKADWFQTWRNSCRQGLVQPQKPNSKNPINMIGIC